MLLFLRLDTGQIGQIGQIAPLFALYGWVRFGSFKIYSFYSAREPRFSILEGQPSFRGLNGWVGFGTAVVKIRTDRVYSGIPVSVNWISYVRSFENKINGILPQLQDRA